jgi:hypothetical protein
MEKHRLKMFCSYAHEDRQHLDQLLEHIKVLQHAGILDPWTDGSIQAGEEWASKISDNLEQSDIILLLVSSSFIASEYCYKIEMERAIELHEQGHAATIPIIVRPCYWQVTPFRKLQALPAGAKAVTTWENIDQAWADVTRGIGAKAEALAKDRTPEPLFEVFKEKAAQYRGRTRSAQPTLSHEEEMVLKFLGLWKRFWFNPARIANWGGEREGFEPFKKLKGRGLENILEQLAAKGLVKKNPEKPHMYKAV